MGAQMKIKESLHRKLDGTRARLAMEKAVKQTMYDLMKEAMKEAPVDTGNLRRSHSVDVRLDSNIIEGLLKNSANYWPYVQFGTSKNPNANDFVTRAFNKVEPQKSVAKYFHENYKE